MRFLHMLTMIAVLPAVAGPALAQDAATTPPAQVEPVAPPVLAPEQQAAVNGWTAERQALYAAWPSQVQSYFWALSPMRQELFWRLADKDRLLLSGAPSAQQEQAWTNIEAQLVSMPSPGESPPR